MTNAGSEVASGTRPISGDAPLTEEEPLPRAFGRYELRRLLGRGGMGSVYLAHDSQLDREVAIKIPRPFGENPTLWRERFFTEARAAAALSHENICPVHDVGEYDGQPFLTMAFIDGDTLSVKLRTAGRLPVGEAVEVVAAVARAMAVAHATGVVHRDLKPGNVMIDHRGRPVVMDFGLALRTSAADDLRVTLTGVALGTPAYMPPEQAGGDVDAIGPPADVYALGVILFELLTGGVPFRAKTFGKLLAQIERDPPPVPSSLNPDLPAALDAIILTALRKDPARRFPSAAEFADALEQFQTGRHAELTERYPLAHDEPFVTGVSTRPYRVPPKKGGGRWMAVAAGFVGLLMLLAGVVFYVSTDHGELKVELLQPDGAEAKGANVDVKVNGQSVTFDPDGKAVTVRAGDNKKLVVTGDDFETVSESFDLKRGGKSVVRVTLIPKGGVAKLPPPQAKPDDPKPAEAPKPPPPKPVEYPKDKLVITQDGYETLLDASKEQMQAWLDEKKKAKHSVLWLDVVGVADKPLYSAVAALDGRAAKWGAYLDLDTKEYNPGGPIDTLFNPKHERLTSVSGYQDGKTLRCAILWRPPSMIGYDGPDSTPTDLPDVLKEVADGGGYFWLVRPYPTGENTYRVAWASSTAGGDEPRMVWKATREAFDKFLNKSADEKRFVPSVVPYVKEGELYFAATARPNPDKLEWAADTLLTREQLVAKMAERTKTRYRPNSITACPHDGAVRYSVVWLKDPPKPVPYPKDKTLITQDGWETLVDATKEQTQAWLDEKKKAKHSVLWLAVTGLEGKPVYTAVAALDDRQPNWTAVPDIDSNDFGNREIDKQVDLAKNRCVALSGYEQKGQTRLAMLFIPGRTRWAIYPDYPRKNTDESIAAEATGGLTVQGFHPYPAGEYGLLYATHMIIPADSKNAGWAADLTAAELAARLDTVRRDGGRPASVVAYPLKGELRFALVSRNNPDKIGWEVETTLTASQLKAKATELADKGLVPGSITALPWDGAVRYSVVWVKEEKKPESKK